MHRITVVSHPIVPARCSRLVPYEPTPHVGPGDRVERPRPEPDVPPADLADNVHSLARLGPVRLLAVLFGAFIAFTIYAANTGAYHPGIALVRWLPYADKVGHVTLWGTLTLLVNLATPGRRIGVGRFAIPLGSAAMMVVVVVEESSQHWLDNRSLDPIDLLANVVGIALATAATGAILRRRASPNPARQAA